MHTRKIIGKSIFNVPYYYVDDVGGIPVNNKNNSEISCTEFTLCRNLLIANLGQCGRITGILEEDPYPIDFIDIFGEVGRDPDCIISDSRDYDIFVVDDQLYTNIRYQKVEIAKGSPAMSTKTLNAAWKTLWSYPEWGVIIQNGEIYAYIQLEAIYLNTRNDELEKTLRYSLKSLDDFY